MPVSTLALLLILFLLICLGLIESWIHKNAISKIPIRIHVNGTRGKSSVTRLIAAGLRAGGIKTFAKTTGSSPRFIDSNGDDHVIQRFRPASIGEQIRMISRFAKHSPHAIVMECMAVQPQYQWVSEHKILQSNYGVLTNVRADHLEEMGYSLNHIAKSLSNTVPYNQKFFTSEDENYQILEDKAIKNNSTFILSSGDQLDKKYLEGFPFIEHPDNIALALDICKDLGVENDQAIKGMRKMIPDPGALTITKLSINNSSVDFVNAFAANDPQSTLKTWNIIFEYVKGSRKTAVFLNTRPDRQVRTQQLLDLVFSSMKADYVVIRGDNLESDVKSRYDNMNKIDYSIFSYDDSSSKIIDKISTLDEYLIVGIGNIVGWGEEFMRKLKGYKND